MSEAYGVISQVDEADGVSQEAMGTVIIESSAATVTFEIEHKRVMQIIIE